MVRGLLRLILIVVVVGGLGAYLLGYRWADDNGTWRIERPVGATSKPAVEAARETGAEISERVAVGANQAKQALSEAGLTAKIKSKMALDDTIDATAINVDTRGTVVTLSGRVPTEAARTRALQLARETAGVTSVVDRLSR